MFNMAFEAEIKNIFYFIYSNIRRNMEPPSDDESSVSAPVNPSHASDDDDFFG